MRWLEHVTWVRVKIKRMYNFYGEIWMKEYIWKSCTDLDRPWGFQEKEAPRFQDGWHMKVVRSPLHPRRYSWYSFLSEAESTEGPNSNDTVGNRTRDLSACSVVPQPTAPPRASCRMKTLLDARNKMVIYTGHGKAAGCLKKVIIVLPSYTHFFFTTWKI